MISVQLDTCVHFEVWRIQTRAQRVGRTMGSLHTTAAECVEGYRRELVPHTTRLDLRWQRGSGYKTVVDTHLEHSCRDQ